ncbi:MAG: cytidine deaminase [Candidatus Latescibacteria bacterium]|nr:cytidine deaminase [Candidatus Latescibacterota bacterium]
MARRGPAELLAAARALLPRASAPYSRFRVAAILEDAGSGSHPGVNVESASFGLSICAERAALFGALASGASQFERLAVVSDGLHPVLPCGACRQVLFEHAPDLALILERADGTPEEVPLRDLMPRPFTDFKPKP